MRVLVSASAPSSDRLLAEALPALREHLPQARFHGPVGPLCRALGVGPAPGVPASVEDVSGLRPWLRALPRGAWSLSRLRRAARSSDLALLVDQPELHGPLAHTLVRHMPVVRLVPPQAWAWRGWRAGRSHLTDAAAVLCLWPFETEWFRARGVPAHTVGFPGLSNLARPARPPSVRPTLAVLPGSRASERERVGPLFRQAVGQLAQRGPQVDVLWAGGAGEPGPSGRAALAAADLALVAVGTATLEAALLGVPTVTTHAASALERRLLGRLLHVSHLGLPSLLLGERVQTEIRPPATPDELAEALEGQLDPTAGVAARHTARRLREVLEPHVFGERVAELVSQVAAVRARVA